MLNYKLTYKFQEKDSRDYTYTTIPHPTNNKLELTRIITPFYISNAEFYIGQYYGFIFIPII